MTTPSTIPVAALAALLCLAPPSTAAGSPAPGNDSELGAGSADAYQQSVTDLESLQGAYGAALPEQLLSLGISLQQQGRHAEAVETFRRGVHVERVNNGLHAGGQIRMLQGEIASHLALGDYEAADQRQQYLYRVQMRSMDSSLQRAEALMQQAQWQLSAYQLELGDAEFTRLILMWDLYRLAINDIMTRDGDRSPTLLRPLQGMLLTQYLIADYNDSSAGSSHPAADTIALQQQANRFNAYRNTSFDKGRAVIQAIYDVQLANHGVNSRETADALLAMGDWTFWNGERETALQAYQQAAAELVAGGAAQDKVEALFAEPVALPNLDGARPLPPPVALADDRLLLQFSVNAKGRVTDLERLDDNEFTTSEVNRLMRTLRKTRFRPRLELGEPVDTEQLTRAYELN